MRHRLLPAWCSHRWYARLWPGPVGESFARWRFRVDRHDAERTISRKPRSVPMAHEAATRPLTLSEQADELEEQMMHELNEKIATKSVLFNMADGKVEIESGPALKAQNPGKDFLIGADPRLPQKPDKTQLLECVKHRFASMRQRLTIS